MIKLFTTEFKSEIILDQKRNEIYNMFSLLVRGQRRNRTQLQQWGEPLSFEPDGLETGPFTLIDCRPPRLKTIMVDNYRIKYRIPDDYNADICPEALVEVEVGLFYKTLIYLDSKTSSFGMKHYLHLRWKGRSFEINSEIR